MSEKKLIYADDLYDKVSSMGLQNGSALGHHSSTADAIAEMIQNAPAVDPASCLNWRTGKPPEHESWFATVYKGNIIKNLIMDCQSYTKYRPNETTGGIFVSWRRKEELPTGA